VSSPEATCRAWIRSQPCPVCGAHSGVEAAHTGPHALGQKASDYSCIPLCHQHHRTGNEALHKIGRRAFQDRFSLDIDELIKLFNALWWNSSATTLALKDIEEPDEPTESKHDRGQHGSQR
jgi:hypothetical protein